MQYRLEATKRCDPDLYRLIVQEQARQESTLEMIASESIQSPQLLEINGCAFNNKTAVGPIGEQELMGSHVAEELMTRDYRALLGFHRKFQRVCRLPAGGRSLPVHASGPWFPSHPRRRKQYRFPALPPCVLFYRPGDTPHQLQ